MPINQSRLITQSNAAVLSLQALNTIRIYIRTQTEHISRGQSYELAYAELCALIEDNNRLFPPTPVFAPDLYHIIDTYSKIIHVVVSEQNHFALNIDKNRAAQMRNARKRERDKPNRRHRRQRAHSMFESSSMMQMSNQTPGINSPIKEPEAYRPPEIEDITEEELAQELEKYTPTPYKPPMTAAEEVIARLSKNLTEEETFPDLPEHFGEPPANEEEIP